MNDYSLEGSPGARKINHQRQYKLAQEAAWQLAHPAPAGPPVDERPLWQQIADPGYYEGTDRRGTLVRGRY